MPSTRAERDAFRATLLARQPGWYSPWAHLAFPSLIGVGTIALCVAMLQRTTALQLLTIPVVWLLSNLVEWRAHRDLLHRRVPIPGLSVLYDRHTPEHHRVFVTEDMAMRSRREFRLVLIPFYGVLAVIVLDAPFAFLLWRLDMANVALLFIATSAAYVVGYEWLHLAYHLPDDSRVGRLRLVRVLRRHHAIHHAPELMQQWNFNVTVPLWDWIRGTTFHGELPLARRGAEQDR